METEILRSREFWEDVTPVAMGDLPFGHGRLAEIPELVGHVLFETSGSTGAPQWVALSKDALLESARGVNAHLRVDGGSCWGLALPLRHVGGFGVVARAYQAGCGFREFGQRWNPEAFRDWIVNERVSHCSLVPTQVHDLAAAGLRAPDSLVAVVVGGGHLPAAAGRAARDLGWPVLASYGMTEAGSQIATQGLDALDDIYQPVPIPLLPLWRAGVTPGGCLWISGPALFSGIFTPSPAGGIFTARAGDGFETRDRVEIRAGWLVPLGRADSCVKVLGELVDTMEIEREVNRLSGGRLPPGTMVVVPVPDARTEHLLVPVFDSSVDKQLVEESLAAYHAQAAGFRRLQAPVWMDELPRSPLGKPRRAEIADRLRKALAGDSKSRSMSRLTFLIIALSVPALVRSADAMTPPGLPTADAIAAGLAAQPQRAAAAAARVRPALERDLARLGLTLGSPVFLRAFKEERQLEVFVRDPASGKFVLFRSYRIAGISGKPGPKLAEGDFQVPEGFYHVPPSAMKPDSRYHLAFNIGYPNAFDRAHGRTGSLIMVHGSDISIGCLAMTDEMIEQIYTLCAAAHAGGQGFFRIHLFPFRMTAERMAEVPPGNPWHAFWANLKQGYDRFESERIPPEVFVRDGRYHFKAP